MLGNNANGIIGKKASFLNLIKNEKPTCFMLQETKVKKAGQFRVEGYQIFEYVRQNKGGGGIAIGIDNECKNEPLLVTQGEDGVEILVVEINVGEMQVRLITGYAPQETDNKEIIATFYSKLEQEIESSQSSNCGTIVELDCNAKLGNSVIDGDPHKMSDNGEMLMGIIQRQNMNLVNSSDKCDGTITRKRITKDGIEESVIDYLMVCNNVAPFVESMKIDEDREHVLTKFVSKNGVKKVVESDHNIIFAEFSFTTDRNKEKRIEAYNVRNEENLKIFQSNTDNGNDLTECFKDGGSIKTQGKKWAKKIKNKIHQSFRKERINVTKKMKKDKTDFKIEERKKLKSELANANDLAEKHIIEDKIEEIENSIAETSAKEIAEIVKDHVGKVCPLEGKFNRNQMWKLKSKVFPRARENASAKIDSTGMLVTNPTMLKRLYLETYQKRLSHRKILPHLEKYRRLREKLFLKRLKVATENKSPDFTEENLLKVLSKLKSGKASDPMGLVNEMFKPEFIGNDLKKSILSMMNQMKHQLDSPKFLELSNITSMYKGKGSRNSLENDRGIFILVILRMIKEKLIYSDISEIVNENMSDSQVGARPGRSIRNHLFVLRSIINSVMEKESEPVDLEIYDVKKCFDALWLEECLNDLYEAGVTDDKLAMIYESNKMNQVAIKTPVGLTDRVALPTIVAQGSSLGPTMASVHTDKIGKEELDSKKYLYKYKGEVEVPSLAMVDDVATVAKCGIESIEVNAYINAKIELKKLTLNSDKCHKIHVGKCNPFCPTLKAHNDDMEEVIDEKYLGDIVTNNGKNNKNIKSRCGKLIGVISTIMYILTELCLGPFYFEIAVLLRETMFLSVMLLNAETWLNMTKQNIEDLEAIDRVLLKKIFQTASSTSTSLLYLESGCYPVRFSIIGKRLMYLYYILTRDKTDLVSKVYFAQKRNPVKNDWSEEVKNDLKIMGLNHYSEEEIKGMKKKKWKEIVKNAIKSAAFEYLKSGAESKSKSENLKYNDLKLQEYLKFNQISKTRKMLLFKLRSRMVKVNHNFGKKTLCKICNLGPDDQQHLRQCVFMKLKCPEILTSTEEYSDIFGENIQKMDNISKLFEKILRAREVMFEQGPLCDQ